MPYHKTIYSVKSDLILPAFMWVEKTPMLRQMFHNMIEVLNANRYGNPSKMKNLNFIWQSMMIYLLYIN